MNWSQRNVFIFLYFPFLMLAIACQSDGNRSNSSGGAGMSFAEHGPDKTGITFSNNLDEYTLKNPFNYINAYNGGGVAIGDVNNDGLQDIYLTGNMVSSKLYLNKGNFEFEDVTQPAGVSTEGWCTGVVMADVNNDGWLDIYVARSYEDDPYQRTNLLFINNQDGTFTEKAAAYGINDSNYSISASFFDYDQDGDLDLIVANHPRYRLLSFAKHFDYWQNPPKEFSSRLFRNDGQKFTDVTEEAGVLSYGFSLGVVTSDLNSDGLPDIFISVDHDEPDIVLQNNGDGTFTDITFSTLKSGSRSSMGIDAGDVNHDIHPDILIVEMLSEDPFREKVSMSMQTVKRFEYMVDTLGYMYYQMRNHLHLNNGNGTFSDVGQLANVHRTDWSWSGLFMDADNDGWQDVFISNGYYRDIYNQDDFQPFTKKMGEMQDMTERNEFAAEYARNCKQTKLANYLLRNLGDLQFENKSTSVGLDRLTITTGAAYGDLNNDGKLDLVTNNIGEPALVYENRSESGHNYLRFKAAHHPEMASPGVKVIVEHQGTTQHRELLMTRGYQASCEPFLHFGTGEATSVDKVSVIWPDGKMQVLQNVQTNKEHTLNYNDADQRYTRSENIQLVQELSASETGVDFIQKENYYDDYIDQVLLPHKLSESGPYIAAGDVNGNGLDDFYIGGPSGQAGALYIQNENGRFERKVVPAFERDRFYEDAHAAFLDINGDGMLDLVVASGSYEFEAESKGFEPRLYLNDGQGQFFRVVEPFEDWKHPASCVRVADFNGNGMPDIFIGGHLNPKRYPEPGNSALFINLGNGKFTNKISSIAPDLEKTGMVKDAIWTDLNNDGKLDLIVVGEWMPISFWIQEGSKLVNRTAEFLPDSPIGWWNCIQAADLSGNGLDDYIVGNLGLNYKYQVSREKPLSIYGGDFDGNGSYDIILGRYYGDTVYPVRGRTCSSEQIPDIKKRFPSYTQYAKSTIEEVYGEDLESALHYKANEFANIILYQEAPGKFNIVQLPRMAQTAPVNSVVVHDVNGDGRPDLIIGGNLYQAEIETGRADAGTGRILLNEGNRQWKALQVHESGLYIDGDVKSLARLQRGDDRNPWMLVGNNRGKAQIIQLPKPQSQEEM